MCQGVRDAEEAVGESHTSHALCDVHLVACIGIFIVGIDDAVKNIGYSLLSKRIGEAVGKFGYICFSCMCQSVHASMSAELLRHCLRQGQGEDSKIWCQVEVSQRIFDAGGVVRDNREGSDFRCGAGCGRNSNENSFLTESWQGEWFLYFFECQFRVFIENPHSFSSVDWGTTADSNDNVRAEFFHGLSAFSYFFNGRIWIDTFHGVCFNASLVQCFLSLLQETTTAHGMTTGADESFFMSF